jgi:hypothetical protein
MSKFQDEEQQQEEAEAEYHIKPQVCVVFKSGFLAIGFQSSTRLGYSGGGSVRRWDVCCCARAVCA